MTLKRMDNVLIVVDDLEAAKAFFIELGLKLEGETTVEGPLVGSLIGLKGGPDILEPDQAPDQRPFDCRLALKLEAQFDEERLGGFEIVDNDEDVVHPFKRHSLPSLPSLLVPVRAARGE